MSFSEVKTIIVVCCPSGCLSASPSMDEKRIISSTIANVFDDNRKVLLTWFVNGDLVLSGSDLIGVLTSVLPDASSYPQGLSHSSPSPQVPGLGTNQPFTQENYESGSTQRFHDKPAPGSTTQYKYVTQKPSSTENQPLRPPTSGRFDYNVVLPPAKTVMLVTHLRYGMISNTKEDVEYRKPDFVVPDEMARDLLKEWSKKSDVELVILMNERDELVPQVKKTKGKERQKWIILHLDETLRLQTRIKHGVISNDPKDVFVSYRDFELPQIVSETLKDKYRSKSNAELFVMSNSVGNLRSIVRDAGYRDVCLFLKINARKPVT